MYKFLFFLSVFLLSTACMKGKKVDLIVHNARIHVMDDMNTIDQAMAIKDGKIVEVGPERQILNKYRADEEVDCKGKDVYPGFTDAHGHLFSYAKQKLGINLTGVKSWGTLLVLVEKHQESRNAKFVIGSGWDQSLWTSDVMPTNTDLNQLFPNIPVALYRVDGHAVLVNDFLLKKAGINQTTKVQGGQILLENGVCTGLLVDKAMDLVKSHLPDYKEVDYQKTILEIQEELFQYGITGVHEAGITQRERVILERMVRANQLKLNVYAMLLANEENFLFAQKKGVYEYKNLSIRSFKMFADGALGSRGALLKQSYADHAEDHGLLLTPTDEIAEWVRKAIKVGYQLNTHAIGDSANSLVLKAYKAAYDANKDHRWRIEHAQVVDPLDFHYFGDYAIFPSVQPTHATTDQRWALQRLGQGRMKGAYSYFSLYEQFGMIALGTDFPVEGTNPFMTLRAAVLRQNAEGYPEAGFRKEDALPLDIALKGMTLWPQYASFSEQRRGSLKKGMEATFMILLKPLMESNIAIDNYAIKTIVKGKLVYDSESLD